MQGTDKQKKRSSKKWKTQVAPTLKEVRGPMEAINKRNQCTAISEQITRQRKKLNKATCDKDCKYAVTEDMDDIIDNTNVEHCTSGKRKAKAVKRKAQGKSTFSDKILYREHSEEALKF
jgi:DNA-binding transcriptional regulator GbsR (MarR family)